MRFVLLCSIILCFSIVPLTKTCFAQETGFIYIRADGSIDPPTAPISTVDNVTYTFAGDIFDNSGMGASIVIERDNIIIDGAGFALQGSDVYGSKGVYLVLRSNVTIRNAKISNYTYGIYLGSSSNNSVSGNDFAHNGHGIVFYSSSDNVISGNNITNNSWVGVLLDSSNHSRFIGNNITGNNDYGIHLSSCFNNSVFQNNFNNTNQAHSDYSINVWDNGYPSGGNYWSDYNGTDSNQDGIGDTPYIIDANNTDHYPLMAQYFIPEFPTFLILPLFMVATILMILIFRRKHLIRAS